MKTKLCSSFAALLAAALLSGPGLWAKDAAAPAAPPKRPTLRIDPSPVSDGKSAVVTSYADVVEPVQKAVVSVYSKKTVRERVSANPLMRQFFGDVPDQERERKEEGLGSGVIISPDGYILTNNHVVEGADELKVGLADDREFIAKVIGTDPKTDVAVIKIEAENLPILTLADSDKLRVGDVVFAVGNPLGVGQTVTSGIVSAKGRNQLGLLEGGYESFIQTDAAINMGNSGGALVDAKGRLVGINSAIISNTRGSIGLGFAIPINLASSVLQSLIATGTVSRGFLGVSAQTVIADDAAALGLPAGTRGAMITDVTPDSPADKAGLKRGDVVLTYNEHPVLSWEELRLMIAETMPNSAVRLGVSRALDPKATGPDKAGRTSIKVEVNLTKFDEKPDELISGVNVMPLTEELRARLRIPIRFDGLLIKSVDKDSPYVDTLVPNVLIVQIDREDVTDLGTAKAALTPGRHMMYVYYRGALRVVRIDIN
ncbi:MAG: serine protease Do/serine protease DegQ [Verrucomicrobia bacterium]|jgi:Do/DeqQ family serine protease|nr:MAG: serine protease Do/serine protease DegQ [Verrucomicrobiota bacterium]